MKYIQSPKAVKPMGPYSQGILSEKLVFVSGTVGTDPSTNAIVPGGIKEQTRQALKNVGAVLEAAGSAPGKVLKATVFLKDGTHFKDMNEVYSAFFGDHKPTRTTVVTGFVKDDILVEIDCIAST
ncbi:MAG: Rid family detoxifying hydrolase [Nitrososphaerales archaeon]|jgi:reactive intermediate/imine deaminase